MPGDMPYSVTASQISLLRTVAKRHRRICARSERQRRRILERKASAFAEGKMLHSLCYSIGEIVDLFHHQIKYAAVVHYLSTGLSLVLCVGGLIGNAIVIFYTIFAMKKKKSKVWFLNLAITDFISLTLLPLHSFTAITGDWSYGQYVCKTFLFVVSANMQANVFILMTLNISRLLSVAKPMFYQKFISKRITVCTCIAIWIVTVVSALPVFIFGRQFQIGENKYCTFFNPEDFDNGPFDPVYNLSKHLNLQEQAYRDMYEKYRHFFKHCSSERCCCGEATLAEWDNMVYSVKWFYIPLLLLSYCIPLCVIIFSNIAIAIQVRNSQTVNTQRLYRIVITAIVVFFGTWSPIMLANMFILVAVTNRELIMLLEVTTFMPFLCSVAYANCFLNPIIYVLVGRQARTGIFDFLSSVRSN
ncbi:chemerin-like receptor 1 [Hyperolius riggenbachi]|uniref:chemerin-like receptor 1 n=1 Tax=Hyperolius riggenbachi TaxID=752182 RepID=UPI0035A2F1A2